MAIEQTTQATAAPATVPAIATATATATATGTGATSASGFSFRTLLSDLNPLQYIPGVGAIYRAVTGDEGNANLRFVASLGTSFALGGPIGVGITIAEKVTGIDPETIGRHLLAGLLHPVHAKASVPATGASDVPSPSEARAWTAAELSAYGVKSAGNGELTAGTLGSADVLNTLELHRLKTNYA